MKGGKKSILFEVLVVASYTIYTTYYTISSSAFSVHKVVQC